MGVEHAYHSTLFTHCNDIEAIHRFYIDILGLQETYYDAEKGWLTCDSGTLNLVFIKGDTPVPVHEQWARQPVYQEGTLNIPSWVITVPHANFDTIVQQIKEGHLSILRDTPTEPQPGHYSFWVRDPMGTTVEIYAVKD